MTIKIKKAIVKYSIIGAVILVIFFIIFLSIQSCKNNQTLTKILEIQNETNKQGFEFLKTIQGYTMDDFINLIANYEDLEQRYEQNHKDIEDIKNDIKKINSDANEKYQSNKGRIDRIWNALFE
jgi:peptidoglycan hydrolase CwlO-like protein